MSPNVAMVTFGMRARAMTASMSRFEVTHTGQPGPDERRTLSGMRLRMPLRAMATVCVPHTSMSVAPPSGASLPMDSMSPRASFGSLNAASSFCMVPASTVRLRCMFSGCMIVFLGTRGEMRKADRLRAAGLQAVGRLGAA